MADLHLDLQLQRRDFKLHVVATLPARGITAIFGPSGCGKSSLLRAIAGLEPEAKGELRLGNEVWQDGTRQRPTHQRHLGMVFQQPSLLRHLSVLDNLRFAQQRSQGCANWRPEDLLSRLGLGPLGQRMPATLSGGEQQRVAIARALIRQPQLLLLDEPFAALDQHRRDDILQWLGDVQREWQVPMLLVTHALDEVARLADHVLLMEAGQVTDHGSASALFVRPGSPLLLREDAGAMWPAQVQSLEPEWHLAVLDLGGTALHLRDPGLAVGDAVRVRLPARDVSLSVEAPHPSSIQNHLQGHITHITPDTHPAQVLVHVACGAQTLVARITRKSAAQLNLSIGDMIWAHIKSVALMR